MRAHTKTLLFSYFIILCWVVESRAADPIKGSYYLLYGTSGGVQKIYPSGDPVSKGRLFDAQVLDLKFVSSGYFTHVALDWALGLEYVPLLQDALKLSRKSSLGVFGEITPRLRFGFEGHWQLGPVLKIVVAKDPTFARYSTAEQFFLTQSGVQFIYDIPFARKYLARLELQTLFDMNVPTRKIWAGVLGFQIGYLSENFTDRDYAQLRQEEKKVYIDYEDAKSEEPENQFVKLTLRSEFLKFSSGQSKLSEESKLYLYRLAYVLNTNAVYWKKLEIHGYIDDSAMERNQASLSLSRAESVQRLLLQGGVAPHKMKSFGDGVLKVNSKKIDKNYGEPSALKDNNERRVELIFRGVLDNDKFQSQLKQ